jgi:alcohol dehydrogenase class IV
MVRMAVRGLSRWLTGRTFGAERAFSSSFRHVAPSELVVGGGSSHTELAPLLRANGVAKPLIVTDPYMHSSGVAQGIADSLAKGGIQSVGIYHETIPEPTTAEVMRGVDVFTQGQYDGIVALGGGSPMDIAKVIGIMVTNGGTIRDYKVPNPIPVAGPPLICVPTTAGTGSEVTRAAVISDPETQEKMLLMSPFLVATAAVVDYKLTMSCPYRVTADSGIDALVHAVEAYVSVKANDMTDGNALQAIRLISSNLRTACADPTNEAAREAMMLGSTLAGLAFSNASVCLVHGMSRPVGVHFHVAHGMSNAQLFPAVTEFSIPKAGRRYAEAGRAMGLASEDEPDVSVCAKLVQELIQINVDLKVPTPKQFGIDEGQWMERRQLMAEQALASGSPNNNPRVPTVEEMMDLYTKAYSPAYAC